MIFSLDVRRARKGDCLLLHCGTADKPGLVMIDGGPKGVYQPYLKPRLEQIKTARGLDKQKPLPVDLLLVSHVDDDHIQGILDLTREMLAAVPPWMLRVRHFWHNTFDDIIGNTPHELTAALAAGFGAASLDGNLPDDATVDSNEDEEVVQASLRVLASIEQGHRLRDDAKKLGFGTHDKLVLADSAPVHIAEGPDLIVAGPLKPELEALQKKHDEWLEQEKIQRKTGADALAAYVDKSVPNLSSIVVLAKAGDKSMLLTGDARGDKIIDGLETTGLLRSGGKLRVNVLKVPHHGSSNSLTADFFTRIVADHYVFSGNGENGNPERETMNMLFDARGHERFFIHLTYPIPVIDKARQDDWEVQQRKEKAAKASGTSDKQPRENWSPAKHSLGAFFRKVKVSEDRLLVVDQDKNKPHLIELLEPLGY